MNQETNPTPNADTGAIPEQTGNPEMATSTPIHTTDNVTQSEESTASPTQNEGGNIDHNAIMGILCYLGPLVLVPYLTDRSDPFINFHIKQGLVLLGFGIMAVILGAIFPFLLFINLILLPVLIIFNLAIVILAIVGIVNVIKREQKPLPVIGGFASKINI